MPDIPKQMRAIVYRGINDLRVETVPVPEIGADELLVKVVVCGVCPTDIKKIQYGTVPAPRIFGHETSGIIVKVGSRLKHFSPGQRVALHHHIPCLKCHYCRHRAFAQCETYKRTGITAGFEPAGGGYAEYVRVMPFCLPGVVPIPDRNTFAEGAMLEPVNTVLKAVNRLALLPRDHVLVIGQGPIGLMFTRLLQLRKMKVIATDLIPARLKLARQFGAVAAFRGDDPDLEKKCHKLTGGLKCDAAIVAVPSDAAVTQAGDLVRGGGQVLLFAHTRRGCHSEVDLARICVDEKDLIGSYSADYPLQREAAALVFSRKLDVRKLITDVYPLEKTGEAVARASRPAVESLKVVVSQKLREKNS